MTDNGCGPANGEDLRDGWMLNQRGFMAGDVLHRIRRGRLRRAVATDARNLALYPMLNLLNYICSCISNAMISSRSRSFWSLVRMEICYPDSQPMKRGQSVQELLAGEGQKP